MVVDQVQRTVTEYARWRIDLRADEILMSAMPGVSPGRRSYPAGRGHGQCPRASHLDRGLRQREKLAARMTEVLDWALLCHTRPTKTC